MQSNKICKHLPFLGFNLLKNNKEIFSEPYKHKNEVSALGTNDYKLNSGCAL